MGVLAGLPDISAEVDLFPELYPPVSLVFSNSSFGRKVAEGHGSIHPILDYNLSGMVSLLRFPVWPAL